MVTGSSGGTDRAGKVWGVMLDIRKRFHTQRVVGPWNRLPGKVVTAPILTELKKCLNDALRHVM